MAKRVPCPSSEAHRTSLTSGRRKIKATRERRAPLVRSLNLLVEYVEHGRTSIPPETYQELVNRLSPRVERGQR